MKRHTATPQIKTQGLFTNLTGAQAANVNGGLHFDKITWTYDAPTEQVISPRDAASGMPSARLNPCLVDETGY